MLPCTSAFFLQRLFFFSCEITGKDICVGRLFTKYIYLPFLTGPFSLHLLWLSKETVWITVQLLPQLNDLFRSTAPRTLPKTTAPLCGYSRGLHAPNSECKSRLKKSFYFFFFPPRNMGFGITQNSPQATYSKWTMWGQLVWHANGTHLQLWSHSYSVVSQSFWRSDYPYMEWPKLAKMLSHGGLGQGRSTDARWRYPHR